MTTPERSVEECQKEIDKLKQQAVDTIMKEGTSPTPTGNIRSTIEGAVHLAVQKAYLITDPEVLQAERQKREEMVEAERIKVIKEIRGWFGEDYNKADYWWIVNKLEALTTGYEK